MKSESLFTDYSDISSFEKMIQLYSNDRDLPLIISDDKKSRLSDLKNAVFFKVESMTYEKKFPRQEAFENVVSIFREPGCRIFYYLRGEKGNVEFYIGVAPTDEFLKNKRIQSSELGEMLERAFRGNFLGSTLGKADHSVINRLADPKLSFRTIMGVPSRNADKEDISFQGVDRLVNIMNSNTSDGANQDFHLLVVWEALENKDIRFFRSQVEEIYKRLSVLSHASIQAGNNTSSQKGENKQLSVNEGVTETTSEGTSNTRSTGESTSHSFGKSKSKSTSSGTSTSQGTSSSSTEGKSHSESNGTSSSASKSDGNGTSKTYSNSKGESGSTASTRGTSSSSGRSSSSNSETQGNSITESEAKGTSTSHQETNTFGKSQQKSSSNSNSKTTSSNNSITESKNRSESEGENSSDTSGTSLNFTTGTSSNKSKGTSYGSSESSGSSTSESAGSSRSGTVEVKDQRILDIMKYIDEDLIPRIKRGEAKGMFKTAVYIGAGTPLNCELLANTFVSLAQGDKRFSSPVYQRSLLSDYRQLPASFDIAKMDADSIPETEEIGFLLSSRPVVENKVDIGTWLTAQEISMLAGFPQKEIPGLELREQVPFGLNISAKVSGDDALFLGYMKQEGSSLKNRKVNLSRKELSKHIFIAGTTGSGKTTTCHRILASSSAGSSLPFLVIEPAKTEYRALLKSRTKGFDDIAIFTVGNGNGVPFRFNPLEFLEEETLSGHIDQLKAAFLASFEMEAAIPNLLEQGLYRVYEEMGWDIATGENIFLKDRKEAWHCHGRFFPTLSLYIRTVVNLVKEKDFDNRLRDEYIGSIRARLESLTTGAKGNIFDTQLSVDFNDLIERNVILELEDVKSKEDKSFIMALVLSRLTAALKAKHKQNPSFKHITLIEEAHRLLTRTMPGDSENRKMGVEMFADLLAEIRKYGESLIVVDQIPSKLASEVLKNTNTKIIHKIFSKDDKDAVGDTMALEEKQRNYLSYLEPGEAIVFSQGWKKPVDVQIERMEEVGTDDPEIADQEVYDKGRAFWHSHLTSFCSFLSPEFESLSWDGVVAAAREAQKFYKFLINDWDNHHNDMGRGHYEIKKGDVERLYKTCNRNTKLFEIVIENCLLDYMTKYICSEYRDHPESEAKMTQFYEDWKANFTPVFKELIDILNNNLTKTAVISVVSKLDKLSI